MGKGHRAVGSGGVLVWERPNPWISPRMENTDEVKADRICLAWYGPAKVGIESHTLPAEQIGEGEGNEA